jgi:hypothetical protein
MSENWRLAGNQPGSAQILLIGTAWNWRRTLGGEVSYYV